MITESQWSSLTLQISSITMSESSKPSSKPSVELPQATWSHLQRYPALSKFIKYAESLPPVERLISFNLVVLGSVNQWVSESSSSPRLVKQLVAVGKDGAFKLDELVNLLVFKEGVDGLLYDWKSHSNTPGIWLLWFFVDYVANISNTLLREFLVKPLHLQGSAASKEIGSASGEDNKVSDSSSLPHVAELSSTTRNASHEIQSKVKSNYIDPTRDLAKEKYDAIVKPTTDKLQSVYIDPTKSKLNETYQRFTTVYENNLSKSESVPKAIVSTGLDLGNATIEKLKAAREDQANSTSKPAVIPTN